MGADRWGMEPVSPLPTQREVFFDPRDEGRMLRLSFHEDLAVFVLSLWRNDTCLGTFRLAAEEAPRLVHSMVGALVGGSAAAEFDSYPIGASGASVRAEQPRPRKHA